LKGEENLKKSVDKRVINLKKADNKQKNKIVLGILALFVIVFCTLTVYSLSIKGIVKEWDNKIYPGVTVQGVDVGGMTKEEANNKIIETFVTPIGDKKLSIEIGDKQYELNYSDIIPKYDIDAAIDKSYKYGKEEGIFNKYRAIKNKDDKKNEIPLDFSYDEEKLKEYEEKIQSDITQSSKDATISIDKGKVLVKAGIEGRTINLDTLDGKLKENINGDINVTDKFSMEVEITKPRVTKEDLSKIKGVMGTFSTSYATSATGRSTNIEIATKVIDKTIVMPGETFSFNNVVGPRTAERGYQEAGTYVGNKVEPGIGGGICQVSTTLYRAAMKANLRSVERTNHSMVVGYAEPGLDATVSFGYLDYKFKNDYDFPIYIQGIIAGKIITYNIYGDPSSLNGRSYDMASEILETIPPETKIVPDDTLPLGQEVIESNGMTGYKAKSYQITYENGVEVKRDVVSTDNYLSVGIVVKKGTQEVVATPQTPPQIGVLAQ
jgi:vancomycin resistance protein YoaR